MPAKLKTAAAETRPDDIARMIEARRLQVSSEGDMPAEWLLRAGNGEHGCSATRRRALARRFRAQIETTGAAPSRHRPTVAADFVGARMTAEAPSQALDRSADTRNPAGAPTLRDGSAIRHHHHHHRRHCGRQEASAARRDRSRA